MWRNLPKRRNDFEGARTRPTATVLTERRINAVRAAIWVSLEKHVEECFELLIYCRGCE